MKQKATFSNMCKEEREEISTFIGKNSKILDRVCCACAFSRNFFKISMYSLTSCVGISGDLGSSAATIGDSLFSGLGLVGAKEPPLIKQQTEI